MQKPEKTAEPSMEEILASIRKIIAEEPIGSRSEPARRNPLPVPDPVPSKREQAAATGIRAPVPGETRQRAGQEPGIKRVIALDDALADLVEQDASEAAGSAANRIPVAPAPAANLPPITPGAEARQRPSWLSSHAHPIPSPVPVKVGPHEPPRMVAQLPTPRDVLRAAVRSEPEGATVADKQQKPHVEATSAEEGPVLGSRLAAPQPEEAMDSAVAAFARPLQVSGPSGEPPGPVLRSPSTDSQSTGKPPAGQAAIVVATAGAGDPRTSKTTGYAAVAAPLAPVTTATLAPAAGAVDTATAAASLALSALAQGLAASTVMTGTGANDSTDEDTTAVIQPVTQPVRTLEDTVADLLRPMLRQWLDANLPRIVEHALRVELPESIKPVIKAGP